MPKLLKTETGVGLERLCTTGRDAVRLAPDEAGLERIEASFEGNAYVRHRHDTYAVGVTIEGIQTFWYRGEQRISRPGQVIVLHPDEVHDGAAGTEQGLLYRMLYVEPEILRAGLGLQGEDLPFVSNPVVNDAMLRSSLLRAFSDMTRQLAPLETDALVIEVADGLGRNAAGRLPPKTSVENAGIRRVGDYLQDNLHKAVTSRDLEQVAGLNRYALHRQFRRYYGTSPHRFITMRRLARGRRLLATAMPIAEIAAELGFADQSHFHRHFVKAFGRTPGDWRGLVGKARQTDRFGQPA